MKHAWEVWQALPGWLRWGTYYGLLVLASHLVRGEGDLTGPAKEGQETTTLPAYVADRELPEREVIVAWRDLGPRDAPVMLLLHGSPLPSQNLDPLLPPLAEHFRLIVPDLPGFGGSQHPLPDYSILAHAHYMRDLMEHLEIPAYHVCGFSQGGGVALHLAAIDKAAVQSVTLLSSIGVIELELMGNYALNQAIYRLQEGAIWLLQEATPHFGLFDDILLNYRYARNFRDSDQRPLRSLLQTLKVPTLIVHGRKDALISLEVAEEHHRIVPQSQLHVVPGGHMAVYNEPETMAPEIVAFVEAVEAGKATTRAAASPSRQAAAAEPFDPATVQTVTGFALVILLLIIVASTGVSEDLACIGAGFLAAKGLVGYVDATAACLFGIFFGDCLIFLMGRWFGEPMLQRAPLRWMMSLRAVERSEKWFQKRGATLVVITRFLPGTRVPTYFAAGVLGLSFWRFAAFLAVAALIWVPFLVFVAMTMGQQVMAYYERFSLYAINALLVLGAALFLLFHLGIPLLTWKGRRRLTGRWRRWTRWEYWPLRNLYLPLFFYKACLAIRYGWRPTFTAVNPAMPVSGLLGESKSQILAGLGGAGDAVARWTLLPVSAGVDARMEQLDTFRRKHGLDWPLVLKPDLGYRGQGVCFARDADEARAYLTEATLNVIVQERIDGPEFGVFYIRHPDAPKGCIFSLTDKQMVCVTGDGEHTLEELILADERGVAMAPVYCDEHYERLDDILPRGEVYPLTKLGTHARGALFRDGAKYLTPELETAVERIARSYDGFYFGRFDIRVPSVEDFMAGRNLKVLECNGVTSEATHIYDPQYSYGYALKTLAAQWREAFAIGAVNAERGAHVLKPLELLAYWLRESREHWSHFAPRRRRKRSAAKEK